MTRRCSTAALIGLFLAQGLDGFVGGQRRRSRRAAASRAVVSTACDGGPVLSASAEVRPSRAWLQRA